MDRIEEWKGKTILLFTPHPDDDTFCCGGTLAKLARNGNRIIIVIFTSDNAGSEDPSMTPARLAAIRKSEEEEACRIVGIPAENIIWYGYDDGMLEYADKKELTQRIAREIRRFRPDAVFAIDPGVKYDQWHKSDHRAAAICTTDGMRAANWRLYFPEIEREGFSAWSVPVCFFYYSADPNYTVDIEAEAELKSRAGAAHFSQFGAAVKKHNPEITAEQRTRLAREIMNIPIIMEKEEGRYVERFRRAEGYGE